MTRPRSPCSRSLLIQVTLTLLASCSFEGNGISPLDGGPGSPLLAPDGAPVDGLASTVADTGTPSFTSSSATTSQSFGSSATRRGIATTSGGFGSSSVSETHGSSAPSASTGGGSTDGGATTSSSSSQASSGTSTALASALHAGVGLMALDDDNVIYTDQANENLYVVPKDGSAPPALVVENLTGINKILGAGSTILWSTVASGEPSPVAVYGAPDAARFSATRELVSDAELFDWTTDGTNLLWLDSTTNATIWLAPLMPGAPSAGQGPSLGSATVVAHDLGTGYTSGCTGCTGTSGNLAATGSEVVWAFSTYQEEFSYGLWSSLYNGDRLAKLGSGFASAFPGYSSDDAVVALTTSGGFAYYVLGPSMPFFVWQTEIYPPGSAPVDHEVEDDQFPVVPEVALDSTNIYWIRSTTEIWSRPQDVSEAPPQQWITGQDFAAITGEPGFIYVADNEAGTITRYATQ